MAGTFKDRKLAVIFSDQGIRQTAFGVAMDDADLNARHPQSERTYPGRTITREEIKDCTGEYLIAREITSQLMRLRFSFDATAYLLYVWLGYAFGAAAAPSGTRTNEVVTVTPSGTISGGTWNFSFTLEGKTSNIDIPWDATASEIQAFLEDMKTIGEGNVSVSGDLTTTVVITFQGDLAAYNLPIPVVSGANLTGSTPDVAIAETTAGIPKTAAISRTTSDQNPPFSLIVGFDGDTDDPIKYKDCVVNSITIRGEVRGKITVELDIVGSLETLIALGFSLPACVNNPPLFTKDCRVLVGTEYVKVRNFVYTYSNNIITGDDAFPYDDINVERLEHDDRTSIFNFAYYGSPDEDNNSKYHKAKIESSEETSLIMGVPSNRIVVNMPKNNLILADDAISFAGEARRSTVNIEGTPFYDSLVPGTPDNVIYYGPETVTLLST